MSEPELEPLITECPSCQTRFRASEAQLQRAGGKVRCGACLTVFDGVENLTLESAQVYADDDQAHEALDALLDELAEDGTRGAASAGDAPAPPRRAAAGETAPSAQPTAPRASRGKPRTPIFSGFEDADEELPAAAGDLNYSFQVVGAGDAEDADVDDAAADEGSAGADQGDTPPGPASGAAETGQAGRPGPAGTTTGRGDKASGTQRPPRQSARQSAAMQPAAVKPGAVAFQAPADGIALAAGAQASPATFGEERVRRPLVWLGIALALVLLAVQVLWYQFDDWAEDPAWHAVYAPLCAVAGCELPQRRDLSLLATTNLAVRSHPERPGMLLVNAIIVNEADFAQPFPVLELRFTTVQGVLVAGRRFEPENYLAGDAAGMELIPPRTPVQIELVIEDPGPQAVNYFLRFR